MKPRYAQILDTISWQDRSTAEVVRALLTELRLYDVLQTLLALGWGVGPTCAVLSCEEIEAALLAGGAPPADVAALHVANYRAPRWYLDGAPRPAAARPGAAP